MGKVLADNVYDGVTERWFGPAYGNADNVPDEIAGRFGDHVWATDAPPATADSATEAKPLDKMSKGELVDLLDLLETEGTTVDVPDKATKAQILEALQAAGVEG